MIEIVLMVIAAIGVIIGSVYASVSKKLFSAVLGFAIAMLSTAFIYFILNQSFLAMLQVIVYVGGVSVLALFAYITSISAEEIEEIKRPFWPLALIASFIVFLTVFVFGMKMVEGIKISDYKEVTAFQVGSNFLNERLFDFEFVSVLLLVALISSLAIASRRRKSD
ncbi:MAG: NADH-quinone oxidoreductase subunit J [Actinobacteria bacterium]|nr:NADH-quinone oxidoreductase subunit J [Actinomycetota bacterium]